MSAWVGLTTIQASTSSNKSRQIPPKRQIPTNPAQSRQIPPKIPPNPDKNPAKYSQIPPKIPPNPAKPTVLAPIPCPQHGISAHTPREVAGPDGLPGGPRAARPGRRPGPREADLPPPPHRRRRGRRPRRRYASGAGIPPARLAGRWSLVPSRCHLGMHRPPPPGGGRVTPPLVTPPIFDFFPVGGYKWGRGDLVPACSDSTGHSDPLSPQGWSGSAWLARQDGSAQTVTTGGAAAGQSPSVFAA